MRARKHGSAGVCQPDITVAARARRQRACAKQHRDDHLRLRLSQLLAQAGEMAAGQVAGFVRQHSDDLVWRFRLHQRAVIDENAAAIGDKRVEHGLIDDRNLDILLLEAGGPKNRSRVVAQELFGLGVAQDRELFLLGEGGHRGGNKGDRGRDRGHFGRFPEEG